MRTCGPRLLHRRLAALWTPQAASPKSTSPQPAPQAAAKDPMPAHLSLDLDDGKVLSVSRRVLGHRLWTSVLRLTLYGQFVAGETHTEVKETLRRLQNLGIRPLLAVPIEEDVGQAKEGEDWYDKNAQSMLTCLDLSAVGAVNPMMQLKVTALMAAALCKTIALRLQEQETKSDLSIERVVTAMKGEELNFGCLTQEENHHFKKSLRRLNSVAQYAVGKGVRVLVDAEYTYINPALTLVTMAMMAVWNTQNPWIWNTYQAYLKDTLERLKQDVALTERLGVCFGMKLVRGAYLEKERKLAKEKGYPDPVQPSWEATNESYQRCLDFGLDQVSRARGRFEMIVATHNEASVMHTVQRMAEMGIDKGAGPVSFGQLLGMCDQVSLALGQAGYAIYKSIPFGSVEEVIPYLIRRAHENQSVLLGIRKERDLLQLELRKRVLRRP
ncbi:hydroxyproline dehydrogenase isoform X2 [Zootoca vivipara]|uniref:hydroxyproline dehydrogenase isoform X2 n=1 Tax=Zootoca vivipara TaxID=8524 RepID=UPI00293C0C78|nr:hydroxyproline dehydrogenase isoform X2 [Zootoca vivipara]